MTGSDLLLSNLLQPIVLAFVLGAIAGFIKSELELPEPVIKLLAIVLLFSLGLTGGRELARADLAAVWPLFALTTVMTVAIPSGAYLVARRLGGLGVADAAALAAHYGSVSTATFFASMAFATAMGAPAEGYLAAMVALMEFGVVYSLALARMAGAGRQADPTLHAGASRGARAAAVLLSVLRGRGILLLAGGMVIGALATEPQWQQIAPFYEGLFRGLLMLFLLEMGITAARQIRSVRSVGPFLVGFGTLMPVLHGLAGVALAHAVGASAGGAFVFGAICASASFIDAPAACRASLPEANPGLYLTASLGITLPFNLLIGLPLYWQWAQWLAR